MTKEKKYKHFTPRDIEPPKTPEEEAEEISKDIKLRDWQRKELARRQGFNPDTYMNDEAESAAVETKFNEMLQSANEWNESERKRMDALILAEIKWMAGMISEEEYNNVRDT
jgi:hypothetical protein